VSPPAGPARRAAGDPVGAGRARTTPVIHESICEKITKFDLANKIDYYFSVPVTVVIFWCKDRVANAQKRWRNTRRDGCSDYRTDASSITQHRSNQTRGEKQQ
jgi:hypothetical protein